MSFELKDFISSKDHMVEYNEEHHVCNNTAHDMLVTRGCFIGEALARQAMLEVPTIFKTLSAFSFLSGLCGAHSTVEAKGEFPLNLWSLLVGASGARKSSAMLPYHTVMGETEALRELMLPEDATTAAYREPLENSYQRSEIYLKMSNPCSSGIIFAQEFGDFVKSDNKDDFSSYMVKMWGDQPIVQISRQGAGFFEIKRPSISILGAIQTRRLTDVIPLSMFHQGFFPRVIPAYSSQEWKTIKIDPVERIEGEQVNINLDEQSMSNRYSHLLIDMHDECIRLSRSSFICSFDRESSKLFNETKLPDLPRQMDGYGNRRHEMFRKICAITAISRAWRVFKQKEVRNVAVVINKSDFEIALKLMTWIDSQIPEFVREIVVSGNEVVSQQLEDVLDSNGGTISEKMINDFCKKQNDPKRTKNYILEFCLERKAKNEYVRKFTSV